MARIAGVNIPTNKRVEIALTYIHGIGRSKAKQITEKLGIGPEKRVQDLSDQEVLHIRETIDSDHNVEGDLRRETAMNIKRLMDLACYRGLRQRPHPQGQGEADRRQEEVSEWSSGRRSRDTSQSAATGFRRLWLKHPSASVGGSARTSPPESRTSTPASTTR